MGEYPELKAMFEFSESRTRGHCLKLKKKRVKTLHRQNFYTERVIHSWNSLPENIVLCTSLFAFKKELDKLYTTQDKIYCTV